MVRLATVLVLLLLMTIPAVAYAQGQGPQLPPSVAPEIFERGRQALSSENYDQAILDFSLFILLNPTDGRAYTLRALSYQGRGETDQAIEDLTHALRFTATEPGFQAAIYTTRGEIHREQGRVDAAIADYGHAVELEPSAELYIARAQLYLSENDFEAAVSDLDEAINLAEDQPILYFYRATAQNALHNEAGAASDYFEWVNRIQERTSQEEMLRAGESVTLQLEPSLVYSIPFEAQSGERLNIVAANLSGDADPLLVVVDDEGTPLVANDDSRGGDTSAVISGYRVPEDGQYTLYVTHSLTGYNGRVIVLLETETDSDD